MNSLVGGVPSPRPLRDKWSYRYSNLLNNFSQCAEPHLIRNQRIPFAVTSLITWAVFSMNAREPDEPSSGLAPNWDWLRREDLL